MELFLMRIFDGLENGAIYGALALAIVLIWRSTGTINMAQGAMGMVSAFVAWRLSVGAGMPILLAVLVAVLAGMLLAALIERVVIRPFEEEEDHLPAIIVTLALGLILSAVTAKVFTLETVTMPSPFPEGSISTGLVDIPKSTLTLIAVLSLSAALIWALFTKTRVGLQMRATVDNPESSRLVGIRRSHMLMLGWALAGGLGALAAVMIAPSTLVSTTMLDGVLLYSFAAAMLGGLDSPVGAVVGGMLLGLCEVMIVGYVSFIGNELNLMTALTVIVVVLVVKPAGLFGHATTERV